MTGARVILDGLLSHSFMSTAGFLSPPGILLWLFFFKKCHNV